MRTKVVILLCSAVLATTGCKKKGTTGGGGGWLVGSSGLMVNIDGNGRTGTGYDLGATETLNEIACRYQGEAWVVGAHGTLLYTNDGGDTWGAENLGTTADLYALATQDHGGVYIGGDGVFFTATPDPVTGLAQWTQLGDGVAKFRSIAAAQHGTTVLAVSDDGGLWSYEAGQLVKRTTIAGARAVALSPDGQTAIVAGAGLSRSTDGGQSWNALTTDAGLAFADARVDGAGEAVAVGKAGAVARIDYEGRVLVQHVGTTDLETLHIASGGWGNTGYTGGGDGQVWITHDNGWSWTAGPNVGSAVLGVDEIGEGHR